jgi:hypothetical protein
VRALAPRASGAACTDRTYPLGVPHFFSRLHSNTFEGNDDPGAGEVLMKRGVVVALLLLAASSTAQATEGGRYVFGGASEQGTFVLDNQTGRVWRYDRVDDAWYLYDLEALVRSPRGDTSARGQRHDAEKEPVDREKRPEE